MLFQAKGHSRPRSTLTMTLWGGTITLDGLSFTEEHELLPLLPDGAEGVFLLSYEGNRYFLAGKLYGAFGISQGRIRPLARKPGFASEYANAEIKAFTDAIAALRSQKRR